MGLKGLAQKTLEWSFFHPVKKEWIDLGKSGSVQEALIRTGELPDPFYGMNESKFSWIEDHDWTFKSIVFIDSTELSLPVDLNFSGVDTYAKLYVNDQFVDSFQNAFIPYHLSVGSFLKIGLNEVRLEFIPPVRYHEERWNTERYHLPAPNDVHKIAIAPYTRKPQYQFGWDWSLRMNTIGLVGEATLSKVDRPEIWNKSVRVLEISDSIAKLELILELTNKEIHEVSWQSDLFANEIIEISPDQRFHRVVKLENPELWWPRGMGGQHIYDDSWTITASGYDKGANASVSFGVKTSELINEPDQWGTSYYFKINGKRVFAKGANYIPQDIFPDRITDQSIEEVIEEMVACNFNMVRVWGGGFYQKESFYKACDKAGIMVWQDLMFACAMYPGDSAFLNNVRDELEYQVPRIAIHPSVMLFNGNNEVEVAWGNWGFQIKYGLYGKSAKEIEEAYVKLFKELAPSVNNTLSSIPYIHTSPLSNWGKEEYYNHGSQHYWGVWHGKDPIEDFGKKIGRFNAEYGFQSFPEFNTLQSFSVEADWDITSDVMKQHQKSYVGNDMILKHAKRLYGEPTDFMHFVYYSQLTQAMAVSMAVAGHRIDAPRCGGTLYWQFNDCWPVSSWSSRDYYGNWKALQYRMRQDYRDWTVLERYEELDTKHYFVVSESDSLEEISYSWKLYRLNGKIERSGVGIAEVNKDHHHIMDIQIPNKKRCKKEKSYFLEIELKKGAESYRRNFDVLNQDFEQEFKERSVCISLQNIDTNAKTAEILITTSSFIADLWLVCDKFGITFEDNFISMLPGERIVKIKYKELPEQEDFHFYYR